VAYKCRGCGGIFEADWSDEEARAETEVVFPGLPPAERAIVCDVCYKLIMADEHIQPDAEVWQKRRRERALRDS
jgi:DNA-directed RNA polymerase subunit RPC12/RpoP